MPRQEPTTPRAGTPTVDSLLFPCCMPAARAARRSLGLILSPKEDSQGIYKFSGSGVPFYRGTCTERTFASLGCLINLQVFRKWGPFLPRTCRVNFRIIGLLSNSTTLAHPHSLSPDGWFLRGKRKAACALLPATDLTPAQAIRPRQTAIHRSTISQDSMRRGLLILALSKEGGARKPTKTVAGRRRRTGVICETWALEAAVIPAKAGIYSANLPKCAVDGLDSRFRGNGRRFEKDPIPNDTTRPGRTLGRNLKRSLTEIPLRGKTQKEDSND